VPLSLSLLCMPIPLQRPCVPEASCEPTLRSGCRSGLNVSSVFGSRTVLILTPFRLALADSGGGTSHPRQGCDYFPFSFVNA
jgi:hypothetical protein